MGGAFTGRKIWITGASSGIGEALAHRFASEGAKLVLSARNRDQLERVKAACVDAHPDADSKTVAVLPLDLADPATLPDSAARARDLHDGVDILVHNAGVAHRDLVSNTTLDTYRRIMQVNYFGPVALTTAVLPHMLDRGAGQFVVISSLSGRYGVPRLSAYSASKHALHGFFDSLRAEVKRLGITITIAVPGVIRTDITAHALQGDGTPYGQAVGGHDTGMSPARCARKIVRATLRRREEVNIGAFAVVTVAFRRFLPGLWARVIRNHPRKRMRRLLQILRLSKAADSNK